MCTLAAKEAQCDTKVVATWHAPQEESLCLVIIERPEVHRCWEHYSEGVYTLELIFSSDLTFQLRDQQEQQRVLATQVLRVIHEAIRYRHRRRQPWNVFD